ncbi:MAG TPA: hypothetical protein VI322_00450 [Candidatus Saccharimonadia bacterium]
MSAHRGVEAGVPELVTIELPPEVMSVLAPLASRVMVRPAVSFVLAETVSLLVDWRPVASGVMAPSVTVGPEQYEMITGLIVRLTVVLVVCVSADAKKRQRHGCQVYAANPDREGELLLKRKHYLHYIKPDLVGQHTRLFEPQNLHPRTLVRGSGVARVQVVQVLSRVCYNGLIKKT